MLQQGDCIEHMSRLPDGCVDLVFADPPFNIDFEYDGSFNDNLPAAEYLAWSRQWMSQVPRTLKSTGTLWLMIGDAFVSELDVLAKELGFHKRSHVVWYFTFGVNSPRKFTPSHSHLLYFTKRRQAFTFNETQIRVPSARLLEYKDKRASPDGRLPDDTWVLRPQQLADGFPANGDIWCISRIAGTFGQREENAANQVPEQLLGRVIRACSNEGDLVLDPFAGTATTATVAKKLGRRYLSYELSPDYAVRCQERLNRTNVGDPLQLPIPLGG